MVNQFLLHIALTVSHFLGHLDVESKFDSRPGFSTLERASQLNAEGTWGGSGVPWWR